jgi:mannose-6-phosphate isomerase-like protein (cupin superfamily)
MPSASPDDLPLQEVAPGYSSRFADWGAMTVGLESAPAGTDAAASIDGFHCHAHHWGYLISGRIVVDYEDGRTEEIGAGRAYYLEPGHHIRIVEDSEAVEFTPTEELKRTLDAVRARAAETSETDAGR